LADEKSTDSIASRPHDHGVGAPMKRTLAREKIDQESWLGRQVFAYFGLAMYWAQCIEHGIANLAVATGQRDGVITTQDEFAVDHAAMLRKTMGHARDELLKRRPDLTEFEDKLRRAVKLRNFLAHGYFRERTVAFMTTEGKRAMVRELERAAEFMESVNDDFVGLSLDMIEAMGATEECLSEIYEELQTGDFGKPLPGL
jgi:hypothetical protein